MEISDKEIEYILNLIEADLIESGNVTNKLNELEKAFIEKLKNHYKGIFDFSIINGEMDK